MKRGILFGIALLFALGTAACNTVRGVGKVIQKATH
jgi:predicted small secreted protein